MEEQVTNLTQDEVLEVISNFPVTPLRNRVIITVNADEPDEDEIETTNVSFSESQFVISKGAHCKEFEVGQKILLDLEKMTVSRNAQTDVLETVSQVKIDPIEVNGRMYAFISDTVIKGLDNRE